MVKIVLDLYSGLGGFSEAFMNDPEYEVVRIEINPLLAHVPNTIISDIFDLDPRDFEADLILASPPCRDFSQGWAAPEPSARRAGIEYSPDLSLVREAKRWIEIIKPQFYLIENVSGSAKWFRKERLYPIMRHRPFIFYGGFPTFGMPSTWKHNKFTSKRTGVVVKDTWSDDPLRANKRGKIPIEISQAIKDTFEGQTTLGNYQEQ